jgi:hypothetical protein
VICHSDSDTILQQPPPALARAAMSVLLLLITIVFRALQGGSFTTTTTHTCEWVDLFGVGCSIGIVCFRARKSIYLFVYIYYYTTAEPLLKYNTINDSKQTDLQWTSSRLLGCSPPWPGSQSMHSAGRRRRWLTKFGKYKVGQPHLQERPVVHLLAAWLAALAIASRK